MNTARNTLVMVALAALARGDRAPAPEQRRRTSVG
jgi:hypothetical protein